MEEVLKNLLTKDDLNAFATKEEMREMFADFNRHTTMLFERTQERLKAIEAQIIDISQRLPPRN